MGNCCVTTDTPGMGDDMADDAKTRRQVVKNKSTMSSIQTDDAGEAYATGSLSHS